MSAIDNTPTNRNFLSPLNFRFQIKKTPHVNYFVQKENIPSIAIVSPETSNPFVTVPYSGEHIRFGDLSLDFKVDEDLKNYLEIHNWLLGLGKPETFVQYRELAKKPEYTGEGIYSDISVIIMSSTKLANYDVTFVDAYPVSLSDVVFNTTDSDVMFMTASAKFKYTHYTITKL